MGDRTFAVAQLGSRMHYAVPRILHENGILRMFITDICAVKGWPRLLHLTPPSVLPACLRNLKGRIPPGIPTSMICTHTLLGVEYRRRLTYARTRSQATQTHLWAGRKFCRMAIDDLARLRTHCSVYCFNSAGLELLHWTHRIGSRGVLEQTIAPRRYERHLLCEERYRHPEWDFDHEDVYEPGFIAREEAEWKAADVILCGSSFVRDGIAYCGGPVEKCVIVPYGIALPSPKAEYTHRRQSTQGRPLRVLTVGAVGLRKGSPYIVEAARIFQKSATFRMVGRLQAPPAALEKVPSNLELTGPVPRSEVSTHYQWADVFLLPSLCEGSAVVTYEALAHGLPVLCTPNTGSVVTDGLNGFIIAAGQTEELAARLDLLITKPASLREMSANAFRGGENVSLAAYAKRLMAAVAKSPRPS